MRWRITFEAVAKTAHAGRLKGWKNAKHRAQWPLETYAFPKIGAMPVGEIQPSDEPGVLTAIETARRPRQRIGVVCDWAVVKGYRAPTLVNAAHACKRERDCPDSPSAVRTIR